MAGVTNWPYRLLAAEEGAALTYSEMVSAAALEHRGKGAVRLLKSEGTPSPFAVQLFGKDPGSMARAARAAQREHGADLIDLNFGCPARKVVKSGHGAALLKDPDLLLSIAEAVVKAVDLPVTVKTRPDVAAPAGGREPLIFSLAPKLEAAGISALALHPRFLDQGFKGWADWSMFRPLKEIIKIPLIGSGDVSSAPLALEMLKLGADFVMLGRATRGRPWLFRESLDLLYKGSFREPPPRERLAFALRHARLLHGEIGRRAVYLLRSVIPWYIKELPRAASFRDRICREEDFEKQLEIMKEAFAGAPEN
jgi:nifR3 family TIM-barrel protein